MVILSAIEKMRGSLPNDSSNTFKFMKAANIVHQTQQLKVVWGCLIDSKKNCFLKIKKNITLEARLPAYSGTKQAPDSRGFFVARNKIATDSKSYRRSYADCCKQN